jgi:glycolate oxidase iron-sulfur subunit
MKKCAKCGACTVVCPVYKASGGKDCYSARGKNHLLEVYGREGVSKSFKDIFAKCLLCGACNNVCPRGLDITGMVMETRESFGQLYGSFGSVKYAARRVLEKPELLHGARFFGNIATNLFLDMLPMENGLRLKLAMFDGNLDKLMPTRVKGSIMRAENYGLEPLIYFPGCSSSYLYPTSTEAVRELVEKFGYFLKIPDGLGCCGLALEAAGDADASVRAAKRNIEALEAVSGSILVTCGSCWAHLKNYERIFADDQQWLPRAQAIKERLVEISQFLLPQVKEQCAWPRNEKGCDLKVFYHDPCHLRNENNVTREPRELLQYCREVELLELEDGPQCCGQGGLFHLGAPKLSAIIRDDLAHKVLAMRPDVITTTCSGCYMQWRTALAAAGSKVRLLFLPELLNERLQLKKKARA